jgi:hypothetical protein
VTEEEELEFRLYGCVSRCVIKASELKGDPVSRDEFVTRFAGLFPAGKFGLLRVDAFCKIVKDLGLASYVNAVRRIEAVKPILTSPQPWRVFVYTDTSLDGDPHYHCRLALGLGTLKTDPTKDRILLFSPSQDGSDHEIPETIDDLEKQFCHFLIAYP